MSGTTSFSATLALSINDHVIPSIPQAGYVPLAITNADGSAPTFTSIQSNPTSGSGQTDTPAIISNTGTSAAAYPYAFATTATQPGNSVYQISADGVAQGTVTVVVTATVPETVTPGAPVVLPLGQALPTGF